MIASGTLDEKRQIAYQSFLFIIMYVAPSSTFPSIVSRPRVLTLSLTAIEQAESTKRHVCNVLESLSILSRVRGRMNPYVELSVPTVASAN